MTNRDSKPTTGGRVILAVFGGVLVFSVLVLLGYLYFSPDSQPCANGEEARNPESQPGVPLPREEQFQTIEGAEGFVCHLVAYPRDESLTLTKITAFRTSSLKDVVEGNAYSEVRLELLHAASGQTLQLNVSPQDLGPPKMTPQSQTVRIQGQEALVTHGGATADYVVVDWSKGGLSFHAQTRLTNGLTQDMLLGILESTR